MKLEIRAGLTSEAVWGVRESNDTASGGPALAWPAGADLPALATRKASKAVSRLT